MQSRAAIIGVLSILVALVLWLVLWLVIVEATWILGSPDPSRFDLAPDSSAEGSAAEATDTSGENSSALRESVSVTGGGEDAVIPWFIRGRCVDTNREPVPGVVAALSGRPYGSSGEEWTPVAPQTTSADGRFAFRIAPPTNFSVALSLRADEFVAVTCGWSPRDLRSPVDLGDIILKAGGAIHGLVTDTQGVPQGGVRIHLGTHGETVAGVPFDQTWHSVDSDDRGEYRIPPLAPGAVALHLRNAILRSPKAIQIPDGVAEHFVPIVIESADEWPSIRGVVVDDAGRPMAGVRVGLQKDPFGRDGRPTREDGWFTVMRPADAKPPILDGPVSLRTHVLGFEGFESKATHAWGVRDVRIELTRLAGLDLRVTDGSKGIEDYSVYIAKAPKSEVRVHLDYPLVSHPGPHEDGVVHIAGLQRGNFLLKVLPKDSQWSESRFHPIRFETGKHARLDVVLEPIAVQRVLVRFAGRDAEPAQGAAVPGAVVELLEPMQDQPIAVESSAFRRASWVSGNQPYLWLSGVTDERGELSLRGPREVDLTLRVSGPGFLTVLRPGVSLVDRGDPIVVEVAAGATVTGVIRPPEFLRQIRELATGATGLHPGMVLRSGSERIPLNTRRPARIADDGFFRIDDVPAGTWNLRLRYVKVGRHSTSSRAISIRDLRDLKDAETRHVELDLSDHLFTTIRGTIFVDAEPAPSSALYLRSENNLLNIFADESGQFEDVVPPGRYTAEIRAHRLGLPAKMRADETIELHPGQTTTQSVHGHTRRVTVQTVDEAGNIVAGVKVGVSRGEGGPWGDLPATDTEGRCAARLPLGKLRFWVSPKGTGRSGKAQRVHEIDLQRGDAPLVIPIVLTKALGY